MNRDPENFNKLEEKKIKGEKKKKKAEPSSEETKQPEQKAVGFASSRLFADQILCLPRPKVTAPKAPRAPGGGVFQTGNKSALTLPMLFYPNCPLSDLLPRSHVLHTLSPGKTPGQGDLELPPDPSPTHPLGVWRELPQALLT